MENNIDNFIEEIVKKSGFDNMPEDFLAEYKEKIKEEAQKRLGIAAIEALPDEKTEEFSELAEKNQDNFEAINDYLKENISDFEEKMAKALSDFGAEIIESAKNLEKKE